MSAVAPYDSLMQRDITAEVLPKIGTEQWQTLYSSPGSHRTGLAIWCALLAEEFVSVAMSRGGWDVPMGACMPGFSRSNSPAGVVTTYARSDGPDGARPLVRWRSFQGAFPDYFELDEEFRFYHNLAEDKKKGVLIDFDRSGREIEVVRIGDERVSAQLKYLRQFQAGTGFYLAIYFESVRYSSVRLSDVPEDERERVAIEDLVRWNRTIGECHFRREFETLSRLVGKVILAPPARERSGIWPFSEADEDEQEVQFIVGCDSDGEAVEHTSHPGKLREGSDGYEYLTPVYFRREVLAKYFAESERYRVSDGYLSCLSIWRCRIDNDLQSHVMVFLGDLGRDLPYEERLHWRQFNVPPGEDMSRTAFRRGFLAEFADASSADLVFRQEYARLVAQWEDAQGWPLFLAPSAGDEHILATVRVPVTESQGEFDDQVIALAKLLVDSLNEKELERRVRGLSEGTKGIGKLDAFLEQTAFPERVSTIELLRSVQQLRSSGSAHRKGRKYRRIAERLGVRPSEKGGAFRGLLEAAVEAIRALRRHYCGEGTEQDSG